MTTINVDALSYSYEKNLSPALSEITFSINAGERWAIIGKNGCGKSTLLKCIGGILPVRRGMVKINEKPVGSCHPAELAKLIAYVPQATGRHQPPCSVTEYVMLGRFSYQGFFALSSPRDREIVREALELTDTDSLAGRSMNSLSGGELQRVFIAAAVAQRSGILLLDEPMSFLDPLHQTMVQRSLDRIHDEYNTTVITVTHDVNLALRRYSHVCALIRGECCFTGTSAVLEENASAHLKKIYSLNFIETKHYDNNLKYYMPESVS